MSTYGSTKSSVLSVIKETTAGTPLDPTAATDYVSMQPDFQFSPNFGQLESAEIRSSIGVAKIIQGIEEPSGSMSHYLKHSGTEGTAPETGDLLESVFGTTSANGTQRTTTSGSSVSAVILGAGGSDFARGKAILVKDGTNGYSIRPVLSVSSNTLTLGFNLATAPATGIGVGKCVNYSPANSGHPSLSIHAYRGNGQMHDAVSGALVNAFHITAQAGQFINTNFAFKGIKYFFNPIRVASTDTKLDFTNGTVYAATITAGLYRDPHELAQAIQDAMNAVGSVDTYTVTYMNNDATYAGKFKIASSGSSFTIKWNTGTNTANSIGDIIGFSLAADSSAALTYYSATAQSYASPYTPTFDSSDPLVAKNNEVMLGDSTDYICFCAQSISFALDNVVTDVSCICAETGIDSTKITSRKVTVQLSALLDKHDVDKFKRYRANSDTAFAFNFGVKSGGNWVAGKCGNLYIPTCTVADYTLTDLDTVIGVNMTLQAFVDSSGNGEVYLNFL